MLLELEKFDRHGFGYCGIDFAEVIAFSQLEAFGAKTGFERVVPSALPYPADRNWVHTFGEIHNLPGAVAEMLFVLFVSNSFPLGSFRTCHGLFIRLWLVSGWGSTCC